MFEQQWEGKTSHVINMKQKYPKTFYVFIHRSLPFKGNTNTQKVLMKSDAGADVAAV
jgi:hypothetical protein